jgi:hypothetical protein
VSGKASTGAAVTGGPPSSSSSARGMLDLVVRCAAYAAMWLGLGQNSHGELAPCRGKSYKLVVEADSSRPLPKISAESRRSELDLGMNSVPGQ